VPSDLGGGSWIWNWQWSCDGVSTPTPCTGCNTSISIRIFSPGDDGDFAQTISSTTASIAQSIASTNQTIQQVAPPTPPPPVLLPAGSLPAVWPLPDPPPALVAGAFAPALAPVLGTALAWFGIDAIPPTAPADTTLLPWDLLPGAGLEAAAQYRFSPDRVTARSSVLGIAAVGVESTASLQTSSFLTAPASKRHAGGADPSRPSKPLHRQAPPHRPPFGFPPDLTAGGTTPGSSSTLGGFALLLGALLVGLPSTLKLLWVGVTTRPRRRAPGRSERPG
jgi:hypothetical protein